MPKRVKYFYDTEFLEDGRTIDLISIGIHCEDGREFYAVSTEFNKRRVANNDWLMENVMTSIGHEINLEWPNGPYEVPTRTLVVTDPAAMSRAAIRQGILSFVAGTWPEFWAWYGAYDHVALCQLFGRMIDLPDRFPMFTMDIKQLHKQAGSLKMPEQPAGLHNALEDARFNKVRYEWLSDILKA